MLPEVKIYYGTKRYITRIEDTKRVDPRGTRRKGLCYPTGCVALGKRRYRTEHGNFESIVKVLWRVDQHPARVAETAYLSMLRYAA